MAGIITISKGHDASYPWKQIGAEANQAAQASASGLGYYLSPAERGGEPPGTWTGRGCPELGLHPGGIVRREVFESLYGQHADPRDPTSETRLGRAPGKYKNADAIYAALLEKEPHATAERRDQLMIEAKAQVRTPDLYWDATFSVSKSISLFHASALANAATAANRADHETAARWQHIADGIWACIMEGNAVALDYLQREAGQTRAGYHPGGRWEDAREWVIASFRQHTSRDGDPQLHVHNLILHKVRREHDGAWRALDSMSLYRHRPAASAIAALAMENALTRRFGIEWVPRRDGHGREIADVGQALMDMFSSRRASIGALTARLAHEYQARYGRAPDARALTSLCQWANHATRRAKHAAPLDHAALVRRWSAQATTAETGALEPLAPRLLARAVHPRRLAPAAPHHTPGPRHSAQHPARQPGPPPAEDPALTPGQTDRLIAEAVATVQQAQPTWTEADLIRHLGERLPAHIGAMAAPEAAALLPELARQALTGHAIALSPPEWPRVPDALRRANGESVYLPHGATRYTTGAQLDLEARLLADAHDPHAPRLDQATAARLLGATQAHLQARLTPPADPAPDRGATEAQPTSGLRLDQAAAAFWALTSARRAELVVGPAGSGKTRTAAEMARIWQEATGGEVIGLATSQTAANILTAAGITRSYNTARFLGHLEGRRGARGAMPIAAGTLIVVDEASMMSLPDLADILAIARRASSKVIITGDHEQLAAVEGGGAMRLLARRLGYAQLTEPQRFTQPWERDATLRLRAGDITVLADYDQHGRLSGGTAEDMNEHAYQAWLADYLDNEESILITRTEEQARELSRRARDDLIRYGRVQPGPDVPLAAGEHASTGDLITARRNDHHIRAGAGDRDLANRDILRITAIPAAPAGRVEVRRYLDPDPATGQPGWSASFTLPRRYLAAHATLAYASTAHAALGRTTGTSHVLADPATTRQALYVGLSRGRQANHAYCITKGPHPAAHTAGSRPDPELDRAARQASEQAGLPPPPAAPTAAGPASQPDPDPIALLAAIMTRDGSELSATETLETELAQADNLAVLGPIWDDLTRREQRTRFERVLHDGLPADQARQALDDPARTWLWRTLREAETTGTDGTDLLRRAITARSLTSADHIARVLDSRARHLLRGATPQPSGPWTTRIPYTESQEIARYLRELAEAMDDRTRRLGEHAAATQPAWARTALGPLPADPATRLDWEHRASVIAAYRERHGHNHPDDPIGPEPATTSPEARAAWHQALTACTRIGDFDLRHLTDGELWLHRAAYQRETAWAPPHVTPALHAARTAARDARINASRVDHEARTIRNRATAARHRDLALRWNALETKATAEIEMLTDIQGTRRLWDQLTQATRRTAIAADTELRRRHPRTAIEPLRPHPAEATAQPTTATRVRHDSRPSSAPEMLTTLGLTHETANDPIPAHVHQAWQAARESRTQMDNLTGSRRPDQLTSGPASPGRDGRQRQAVLQPPARDISPSAHVAESHRAAEPEREAG